MLKRVCIFNFSKNNEYENVLENDINENNLGIIHVILKNLHLKQATFHIYSNNKRGFIGAFIKHSEYQSKFLNKQKLTKQYFLKI